MENIGARIIPQIKVNGKPVGGYNEFAQYVEDVVTL